MRLLQLLDGTTTVKDVCIILQVFVLSRFIRSSLLFLLRLVHLCHYSLSQVIQETEKQNGCMAIPNLIGLIGLRKEVIAETEEYFKEENTYTIEELSI